MSGFNSPLTVGAWCCRIHPCICRQYKIGPEKGALFEQTLQQAKPTLSLELGTFLGYAAIRTARNLAPGGRLICVEANPDNAAVARQLLQFAGVPDGQVIVVEGLAKQVINSLPLLLQDMQQQQGSRFDVVFLDHSKNDYLPDLQRLEQLGLVRQGTTVMADNVVYPGNLLYVCAKSVQLHCMRLTTWCTQVCTYHNMHTFE
jgi:catechol O-methyltransferase